MTSLTTSSNVELNHAMRDVPNYRGCHYKDWCNMNSPEGEEYIIFNLANKGERGTHWVCVCNKPNSKDIEFFDSYGLPIPETILNYMKRSGKRVVGVNNEIQAWESKACGWYCVDYLIRRSRGESIYDIIYSFQNGKDQIANDKLLKRSLRNNFVPENKMAAAIVSGISQALPILGKIAPYVMQGIRWIDTKVKEANARRRVRIAARREKKLHGGGYGGGYGDDEDDDIEDEYEEGEGFLDVVKGFVNIAKPSTATLLKMASTLTTKFFPEVHDQVMNILVHYAEKRMKENNYGSGLEEDGSEIDGQGIKEVFKRVFQGFQPSHRFIAKTIINILKKNIDPAIAQDVADILHAALRRKGIDVEGDGFKLAKFRADKYPSGKGKKMSELNKDKKFKSLYDDERSKGIGSEYWTTRSYDNPDFQSYFRQRLAAEKHAYLLKLQATAPKKTKLTPLQEARIEEKVERETNSVYGQYKGRKGSVKLNIAPRAANSGVIGELQRLNKTNGTFDLHKKKNPWQEFVKKNINNSDLANLTFGEKMKALKVVYHERKNKGETPVKRVRRKELYDD